MDKKRLTKYLIITFLITWGCWWGDALLVKVTSLTESNVFLMIIFTIGTINLDYRSLYLHFECGVWMYQSQAVREAKEDMEATFPKCKEVSLDFCNKRNIFVRGIQSIMRLIAPLL